MNRRFRPHAHRLADALEATAEWLRAKAARPERIRPLRFPTASELLMQRILDTAMQNLARHAAHDLLVCRSRFWTDEQAQNMRGSVPTRLRINRIESDA